MSFGKETVATPPSSTAGAHESAALNDSAFDILSGSRVDIILHIRNNDGEVAPDNVELGVERGVETAHHEAIAEEPANRNVTFSKNDGQGHMPNVHDELQQNGETGDEALSIATFLANWELIRQAGHAAQARRGINPYAYMTGNGIAIDQFVNTTSEEVALMFQAGDAAQRRRDRDRVLFGVGTLTPLSVNDENALEIGNGLCAAEIQSIIDQTHMDNHVVLEGAPDDATNDAANDADNDAM